MSKAKEAKQRERAKLQAEAGARVVPGKNVQPLNRTEHGAPRHSGREIPKPTRAVDLTDEVCDLSPRGRKR
jgi:hypothetical protein